MKKPIQVVVVTGGTRGIGEGLVRALHAQGTKVAFCGRTEAPLHALQNELGERVFGRIVDVSDYEAVHEFWDATVAALGPIDAWVNNAGMAHDQNRIVDVAPERMRTMVQTNILGAMFGSKVALQGFERQGHGWLFNMEGLGSDGRHVERLTGYGLTKAALRYLDDGLVREAPDGVNVCSLSPGMVMTRLVLHQYQGQPDALDSARRMFNILGDKVETVAPWLAKQILDGPPNGARIKWLTNRKVAWRFLTAPFSNRDVVPAVA